MTERRLDCKECPSHMLFQERVETLRADVNAQDICSDGIKKDLGGLRTEIAVLDTSLKSQKEEIAGIRRPLIWIVISVVLIAIQTIATFVTGIKL